jgi:hypothetical protein
VNRTANDVARDLGACTELELTAPVDLCRPDGTLNVDAVGWSRHPVHRCTLPHSRGRGKRWDYWCVTTPTHVLSLTYADVDYAGTVDVWFRDLERGETFARGAIVPLARHMTLPDRVAGGDMRYEHNGLRVAITEHRDGTQLSVACDGGNETFTADVFVTRPAGHETLSVVIPWGTRRFQCTTKENTRPASGTVAWNGRSYAFDDDAWGCLDFGRGKWPYRTEWNWGAASGRVGARVVGLQFGGKWTDGTGMTENALCVDGRLSKLSEELVWEYDRSDWLHPWRIRTPHSDRVDVTFTPVYDKPTSMQFGVMASRVHQCFGRYAGTVVPDDGVPITVDGLFGWAEEARWRW